MTRARSRADQTDAQIAAMELARGRTKESLAWDLVNTHDVELKHVNRRVEGLETTTHQIAVTLGEIKTHQQTAQHTEAQILKRLDSIVDAGKETAKEAKGDSRWHAGRKTEWLRNLIAFGCLVVAILATALDKCNRY